MYPGAEFPQGAMGQWRLGHPDLQVGFPGQTKIFT